MSTFLGLGTSTFFGNTVRASTCLVTNNFCSLTPGNVILPLNGTRIGATDLVTTTGTVQVGNSAAPVAGQLLVALNATSASWVPDPGPGNVINNGGSTDNAITRFSGASGTEIQNSGTTLDDDGNFAGPAINTAATGTNLGQGVGILAANDTFIGAEAGADNTTGTNNTFLGTNAGNSNTEGENNTFLGTSAGAANLTANNNTFIGTEAGLENSDTDNNTFVGRSAGQNNIAANNTFVGSSTGIANLDGLDNTFMGHVAGSTNTEGNSNTFIGKSAGLLNLDGDSNTFIGTGAGISNSTTNDNTFLGRSAGQNNIAASNTFIGRSAGMLNSTGTDNVYIGHDAGTDIQDGNENTFIGKRAGGDINTTVSGCVLIGHGAGASNSVDNRLMIDNTDNPSPLIDGIFTGTPSVQFNGTTTLGGALTTPIHRFNTEIANVATAPVPDAEDYIILNINGINKRIAYFPHP